MGTELGMLMLVENPLHVDRLVAMQMNKDTMFFGLLLMTQMSCAEVKLPRISGALCRSDSRYVTFSKNLDQRLQSG